MDLQTTLTDLYDALLGAFGHRGWWPGETPLEVMVGAILTQRTNWRNASTAIDALRAADALDARSLACMDVARLQEENAALKKTGEEREAKLAQALSNIARLQEEKASAERSREDTEAKLTQAQATGQAASTKAAELEKQATAEQERAEKATEALNQRTEENANLQTQANQLKIALSESQNKNVQVAASLKKAEAIAAERLSDAERLREQAAALNAQIETLKTRYAALEKELAESRDAAKGEGEE